MGPPPRRDLRGPAPEGDLPEVVEAIVRMAPQRVVYVSCDPALGRMKRLREGATSSSRRRRWICSGRGMWRR